MSEGPTRRARSPAARLDRRAEILAAAGDLFSAHPYEDVHMAGVAARAGLAKGTLYLYFPTKESLFLGLALDRLESWAAGLEAALAETCTPAALAAALAGSLDDSPTLVRLLALLHATLERHADLQSVFQFKERLGVLVLRVGGRVAAALGCPPEEGARLLIRTHALVVGLAPMSQPPPTVAEALKHPALSWMTVDFRAELTLAIEDWIHGSRAPGRLSPRASAETPWPAPRPAPPGEDPPPRRR